MDILLIEDNDHRRVALLKDLLSRGHRVTPSSSIEEAEEILGFVYPSDPAPDVIVMPRELMDEIDGRTLCGHFARIRCILLPTGRGGDWLADRLEQPVERGLDILLIEADGDRCTAMLARMADRGDRVTICRSVADAQQVLATAARAPDAIVSDVHLDDGNGLSFYLAASRRFPEVRWIVTTPPQLLPADVTA